MEFEFSDLGLEDVYYNPSATLGRGPSVDKGFRKVINAIQAAHSELDLREMKGLHYHKLDGKRDHQHAFNITGQWRLIVERDDSDGYTKLIVITVEDYH